MHSASGVGTWHRPVVWHVTPVGNPVSCTLMCSLVGWHLSSTQDSDLGWVSQGWTGMGRGRGLPVSDTVWCVRVCACVHAAGSVKSSCSDSVCVQGVSSEFHVLAVLLVELCMQSVTGSRPAWTFPSPSCHLPPPLLSASPLPFPSLRPAFPTRPKLILVTVPL